LVMQGLCNLPEAVTKPTQGQQTSGGQAEG